MEDYSLTERGKFIIAILIVFLLVLPSLLLIIYMSSEGSPPDTPPPDTPPNGSDDIASELTNGDNNSPHIIPPNGDRQGTLDPSVNGPIAFDLNAGTMTFLFTPAQQTTIDENTATLLEQLIEAADKSGYSSISVEIPQLTEEDTITMTTVILNAFLRHGITLSDISFFVYQPSVLAKTHEIRIAFR